MRLFDKLTGGRVFGSRVLPSREARASTRPPVFFSARALEAAIDAATFIRREPNDDGERIIVLCNALGGSFIYSRLEAERRIILNFPGLVFAEVTAAARFLENRVIASLQPIQHDTRQKTSWALGWRGNY
jgi:hypothetical protein